MKRWFSLMLALALLCAQGTGLHALAEEPVIDGVVDAEALPAQWSGNGLTTEDGDLSMPVELSADGEAALEADEAPEEAVTQEAAGDFAPMEPVAIQLVPGSVSVGVKEKYTRLAAALALQDALTTLAWRSANTKIAKVDAATGAITGVKAGTTTVYARTANGLEAACQVKVMAAPKKVSLNAAKLTLAEGGQTFQLAATLPKNTASTIEYISSNPAVAAVDESGLVTALAPGSVTITARTFNGKTAKCAVTVYAAPDQVLLPAYYEITQGVSARLDAAVLDANGFPTVTNYAFWAEDGTGAVTVDAATGEITGLRPGTAFVRVAAHNGVNSHLENGERAETVCLVNVLEGPVAVGLAATDITIGVKQTFALSPVLLSAAGEAMPGSFTVASSNAKKLSVTQAGVVKGVSTGTYTVTVKSYNNVSAACVVHVVKAPSKVTITPAKPVLGVGQTGCLGVSFPAGTMGSCTFSSSAPGIASVDGLGNVTGHAVGTAKITAKAHNGKKATVTVTVTRGPDYLALNGDYELNYDPLDNTYSVSYARTLWPGESFQLAYENEYQTYGDIAAYESRNPAVAVVSPTGLVTAIAPGAAVIVARSTGGAEAYCEVTVPGALPASIAFAVGEVSLRAGESVLVPALRGENIGAAELASAVYASGDESVFAVAWSDEENAWVLRGVNPGAAALIAGAGGAFAQANVTVTPAAEPVAAIAFEDGTVTLSVGERFAPRVTDGTGNPVDAALTSLNEAVVAVDESGALTALAEGDATVLAVWGDLFAAMNVSVRPQLAVVTLNAETLVLAEGERFELKAQVNGVDTTASNLVYATSDVGVASVSRTGRIVARRPGMALITASTAGGASAVCMLTVAPRPTRLSLQPAEITAPLDAVGAQLAWAFGAPDEAGGVTFATANPAVAQVNEWGYVTFTGVGRTVVTAATGNGLTASVEVTVTPAVQATETPNYRLFAAYSYFDASYAGYIPFPRNNAQSLAKVFGNSSISGLNYTMKVVGNPSKTALLSAIAGYFAEADDNDVSVVYLCSHGHMTGDYSGYRMSLPGYTENPSNRNYYMTSQEIFNCVSRIRGSVVLILDSCYSGTFLQDMEGRLNAQGGRIAVLTAASDTRATFYNVKDTNRAVDFFSFFMMTGLGYNPRDGWWNANAKGSKGKYPGYLAADVAGNGDGIVTLGELFGFTARSIAANIPSYMRKSWYWGDKTRVQAPRYYPGALDGLVIYQPK